MSIHEKEEALFKRWEEFAKSRGDVNFAPDGLLYRGDATAGDEPEGDKWVWGTVPADEEKRWNDARRRLLIVTKDLNNGDDDKLTPWDIRIETGYKNTPAKDFDWWDCIKFYRSLRMWSYGLLKTKDNGEYPSFEEVANMDNSAPFYLEAPIARMNVKKECGGGVVYDSVLSEHIKNYKDYIIEQLDIYDKADIIFASGKVIYKYIIDDYFTGYKKIKDWITVSYGDREWINYSPSIKKIVICGYHPSHRYGHEFAYNQMMKPFSECVKMLWGNE